MTDSFEEQRFRRQVDKALAKAETVLDVQRAPRYPTDVAHTFGDKYLLAESVVNLAIAAEVTALQALGLSDDGLMKALSWADKGQAVTLRLKSEHRCEYDREESREEEGNTEVVTKLVGVFKRSDKVFTTIIEYFWKFAFTYELLLFAGTDVDEKIVLRASSGNHEIKTRVKETPRPVVDVKDALDLNISWLLQHVNTESLGTLFGIHRGNPKCFTPRRNPDVDKVVTFFAEANHWGSKVQRYFLSDLFEAQQPHGLDVATIEQDTTLFVPILPLMEEKTKKKNSKKQAVSDEPTVSAEPFVVKKEEEGGFGMLLSSVRGGEAPSSVLVPYVGSDAQLKSPLMAPSDLENLLGEQKRSIEEKLEAQDKVFPATGCITPVEARLALLAGHQLRLCEALFDGLNYVEDMLRKQLVAAIGKEVQPQDFAAYMLYHNRKLFREEFRPRAFSYAVRRPNKCPEGEVSIVAQLAGGDLPDPIQTLVSRTPITSPLSFGLDAASNVSFTGELLVHGWMGHQFSGASGLSLSLHARARQFSSFLILIGRISGPGLFDPKYGMICKDKDEFRIPLELETIPSAKEFKEAISSLSDAQQRFAKAYRGMQLSSTLFGVCVIQIKPQLEKLLKIPDNSLTKELELSQDILKLFLKYQIPSDLMTYDFTDGRPHIPAVRASVKNVMDMIEEKKDEEVHDAVEQQVFDNLNSDVPYSVVSESNVACATPNLNSAESYAGGGGIVSRLTSFFRGAESAAAVPYATADTMEYNSMPMGAADAYAMGGEGDYGESGMMAMDDDLRFDTVVEKGKEEATIEDAPAKANQDETKGDKEEPSTNVVGEADDLTLLPKTIEAAFEARDPEGSVRPTIINVGDDWTKRSQANLLAESRINDCDSEGQRLERQECFDLLDALTRSGGLPIDNAQLHIVVAASHCFDKTVMNTLVQKNESPIESVERSTLILASTIFKQPIASLVKSSELARLQSQAPFLFNDAQLEDL